MERPTPQQAPQEDPIGTEKPQTRREPGMPDPEDPRSQDPNPDHPAPDGEPREDSSPRP